MKLSEEMLDEGRAKVTAMDLEGLMTWVKQHVPTVDASEVEKTFRMLLTTRNPDRALKLFDKYFPKVDPARDIRRGFVRLGCLVFVGLGVLGGIIYLVQTIF